MKIKQNVHSRMVGGGTQFVPPPHTPQLSRSFSVNKQTEHFHNCPAVENADPCD